MNLSEQDGVIKQHVEPGEIRPETQVVLRGEEGACGSITVMYLVNRPAELAQLLRSLPHVASVSSEPGDDSPEAQEELDRIARELEYLPDSGAADRVNALLADLTSRLIVTEASAPGGLDSAAWGSPGTLAEYLAEEENVSHFYGILALFCTDEAVRQSGEEIAWCQDALPRVKSERRFRLPGDEALVARAVNLYNRGLGDTCGGW